VGLPIRTLWPMSAVEDQFTHDLRLAREISLGLAAFFVFPDGAVLVDQLPDRRTHLESRVESLARDCLAHPSSRTGDLFWNAKVMPEADTTDDSVACVAIGLEHQGVWLGLLGVADTWLPELDAEQRHSLIMVAHSLADAVAAGGAMTGGAAMAGAPTTGRRQVMVPVPSDATRLTTAASGQPAPGDAHTEVPPVSSEGFLSEVVDHLPEALIVAQDDGTIIYANQQFSAITGLAQDVLLGGDAATLFGGDDPVSSSANWPEDISSLFGSAAPGRRLSVASADNGYIPVDAFGQGFTSQVAGECHVGLIRRAREELSDSENPVATGHAVVEVLAALDEGILVCDARGTVLMANRPARTLQGLDPTDQLIGRPIPTATRLLRSDGTALAGTDHPLERALRGTSVPGEPFVLDVVGNERRHILASARPITVENGEQGALLVLRDTTPQVQSEAWLTHLAMHDPLTGLANRHLLVDHLRRMLAQTGNRGSSTVSVVYLDLDGFKAINDEHGHEVGDGVLTTVAQRLRSTVRPNDVVARLGGDEFVIAHASQAPTDTIEILVSRVRKSLAAPFQVHPHVLAIGASVGYVSAGTDDDPLSLLVRADREMFRRKKAARSASRPRQ
jgi:diguanylate cyclase (GGDEF)-like protein